MKDTCGSSVTAVVTGVEGARRAASVFVARRSRARDWRRNKGGMAWGRSDYEGRGGGGDLIMHVAGLWCGVCVGVWRESEEPAVN